MHTISGCEPEVRGPTGGSALEPDLDELRALGHRIVDDLVDWLAKLEREPAWRKMPPNVRASLAAPLPREPLGLAGAYAEFRRDVFPYRYGNVHPRFFGWVNGSGLPVAVLGDLLASAMNSNAGGFDQSAVLVEEQVLAWLREALGFPAEGGGILTSGDSMANLLGLAAARSAKLTFDVRLEGLAGGDVRLEGLAGGDVRLEGLAGSEARRAGASGARFAVYGSSETHSSVTKALELLGLGARSLRRIPVDLEQRVRLDLLERAIAADRASGIQPLVLVGNAGTVNTGATDDLARLADLAAREDLWLHVDGAFGALAWLCPEERPALLGLQRADSLAFDLHKWLYLPSDIGCVLVRDPAALERAFAFRAPYLENLRGGLTANSAGSFKDRGLELTRRFRALKAWLALKAHGIGAFERALRANLAQARHLGSTVQASERLELCASVPLNVVCFRYRARELDEPVLDELNRELLVRLQESGVAVPSSTVLAAPGGGAGRFALRAAITNHRTTLADVELLAAETVRLGDELVRELRALERPLWLRSPTPLPATR
jgi:glutamate/tyrosine decarboxylase-like PLP-dependent enzyme